MAKKIHGRGFRLEWFDEDIEEDVVEAVNEAHADLMLDAERWSKRQLYPGHGYDTGTLQRSIHVAEPMYPWDRDHVEPTPHTPERGGKKIEPRRHRGRWALELGSGQRYAWIIHQTLEPFLRRAHEVVVQPQLVSKARIAWRRRTKSFFGV